jgi:hypothetical protein
MDAPARSLRHLEASMKGVIDAMMGGFARGIEVSKLDLEKSMEDFPVTSGPPWRGQGRQLGGTRLSSTGLRRGKPCAGTQ